MLELLTIGKTTAGWSTWLDVDFAEYPVGTTTGFVDKASGVTFNRQAGTAAIVLDGDTNAMEFNGSGTLSGGTIADQLGNNDFKITLEIKIASTATNHALALSRSTQGNGAGIWTCDFFPDGRPDFWFNGNNSARITSPTAITKGVYHTVVWESINNLMSISSDGVVLTSNRACPNINVSSGFPLIVGGSQDQSAYHLRGISGDSRSRQRKGPDQKCPSGHFFLFPIDMVKESVNISLIKQQRKENEQRRFLRHLGQSQGSFFEEELRPGWLAP